jgi:putative peptidoglycan lipid II flippase
VRGRGARTGQSIAGAALLITIVTIVSRLLGFGRWIVQAQQIGTQGIGTAYATANTLPNILYEVAAGGALAGAVVPLLAGPIARAARVDVNRSASAMLTWALAVLVPLAGAVALLARPIVSLLLVGVSDPGIQATATFLLRVFALQIPLYGIGVVLGGVLQAHRRFFWPAAAPIWSSLVGVAVMSLSLLGPTLRTGTVLRPTFRFPEGQAARAGSLAFAGIGAIVAQQLATLAIMRAANRWGGDGTLAIFQYAQAVYLLPYAVLAVPLATSAFPRLAERASAGDDAGFARLVASTSRLVLTVTAVGAAALAAASRDVESLFASFTPGGVDGMAVLVAWLAPGLLGFALIFHLSRVLYSLDHGRAAVRATALGWGVVIVGALALPPVLSRSDHDVVRALEGIGVASSLGMTVAGVALLVAVRRFAPSHALAGLPRTLVVIVGGAIVGAALGAIVSATLIPDGAGAVPAVGIGLLAALVAGGVVIAASVALDRGTVRSVRHVGREPEPVTALAGEDEELM